MTFFNSTPYSNSQAQSANIPGGTPSSIQFNNGGSFAGSSLLGITQQISPVNGFNFTLTSTNTSPILKSIGSNTNIGINFQSKGDGNFVFTASSGETLFKIQNPSGTLDRYLFVAPSDNTSLVEIGVEGNPINASIQISPKGNGSLNIAPSGTNSTDVGEIKLFEGANGSEYVSLKAPQSINSALSLTLPSVDGSNGDVLITNGSGTLSFAPVVGSSGTSGLLQISDGSKGFTSDSNFYYNTSSKCLSIGITSTTNKLQLHESEVGLGSYLQISNNISGSSGSDGLILGINGSGLAEISNKENTDFIIQTNNSEKLRIKPTGELLPGLDNLQTLGSPAKKWLDLYVVNAQINISDERQKYNIKSSDLGLEFIKQLNPVTYIWKKEGKRPHYGFISQEVKKALDLVNKDFGGFIYDKTTDIYGLRYSEFIAPIVKSIQELDANLAIKTALITPNQETLKSLEDKIKEIQGLKTPILIQNLNNKIEILESKLKEYDKLNEIVEIQVNKEINKRLQELAKSKSWWNNLVESIKKLFSRNK